jgi:putative transposase
MIRTFRYKLFVNKSQRLTLDHWRRVCQQLYNAGLQERRDAWQKQRVSVSRQDQCKQLTEIRSTDVDVAKVPAWTQQQVFRRLDRAFQAFFRRCKTGDKPGYPRFRSFERYESISIPKTKVVGDRVSIPKLGAIRFHKHRDIVGEVLTTTLKLTPKGWFVLFSCDIGAPPPKVTVSNAIGVDLGLESFITLSDGSSVANPRYFKRGQEILARRQRSLAMKRRGSTSRKRAKLLVARAHERIRNQRLDFSWKLSHFLLNRYDLIAHEDLQIRNMLRGTLAKSISDAAWATFIHALSCKAEEAGKTVVKVDPRGTSQRCHSCGTVIRKTLSERRHRCLCGVDLHRDHNAALNVLALGLSVV